MTRFVVLLKGINVGGNRRMKMSELKLLLAGAGVPEVTTLLQSGNVIVESNTGASALTELVETAISAYYGFDVAAIIRTGAEFVAMFDNHPFSSDQLADPRMAHVMMLKTKPSITGFHELQALHEGPEDLTLIGNDLFIHYPSGAGRSNLSGKWIERALGAVGTARNWNTITRLRDSLG